MASSVSSSHARDTSSSTASSWSTGASYAHILEHISSYPGSYDSIPLRTMFDLNCRSRNQSQANSPTAGSPIDVEQPDLQVANAHISNALLSQIGQLPNQPLTLPPSFLTMFVKRCWTPEIHWIDFPQSLTALDYLRDLESRRRKEVNASLSRLGVSLERGNADIGAMRHKYPSAATFVADLLVKDKRADALYTQLYIALRRWILINEMSLQPFNKHNCIAMLNTLYPPVNRTNPTAKLTPVILAKQRDGFFRYIKAVETRGVGVLKTLQNQGAVEGEENGWLEVHRNLEKYLRLTNTTINECSDMTGMSAFAMSPPTCPLPNIPQHGSKTPTKKTPRKTDSGVSFNSSRPSSSEAPELNYRRPSVPMMESTKPSATPRKGGSTLERIARELNRLRKKPEVEEIIKTPAKDKEPKTPRGLRKMKSLGTLSDLTHSNNSSTTVSRFGKRAPKVDFETLRQERLAYETSSGLSESRLGYEI